MIRSVFGSKKYRTYTVHTRRLGVCTVKRPDFSPIVNFEKSQNNSKTQLTYIIYIIYIENILFIYYIYVLLILRVFLGGFGSLVHAIPPHQAISLAPFFGSVLSKVPRSF